MTMSGIIKPTGRLFLIVGNSGSGKDSLLAEVLTRWPISEKPIRIPQRYITRPAHDSEQYISVTTREFGDLKRNNKIWLTWHVYNTDYGVPTIVLDWLSQRQHVVVNVSREIIPRARRIIPDLKVIFVSVPLEITLQRMRSRRREAENEPSFQQRLHRAKENQTLKSADFIVDNSGSLDVSAKKLLNYILSFGP
jgi:ribose 1,5-bisphosphokinase